MPRGFQPRSAPSCVQAAPRARSRWRFRLVERHGGEWGWMTRPTPARRRSPSSRPHAALERLLARGDDATSARVLGAPEPAVARRVVAGLRRRSREAAAADADADATARAARAAQWGARPTTGARRRARDGVVRGPVRRQPLRRRRRDGLLPRELPARRARARRGARRARRGDGVRGRPVRGAPHGFGTLRYADGTVYVGNWRRRRHGFAGCARPARAARRPAGARRPRARARPRATGRRTTRRTARRRGARRRTRASAHGAPDGRGAWRWEDGSSYVGPMRGGERTGPDGAYVSPAGDCYVGALVGAQFHDRAGARRCATATARATSAARPRPPRLARVGRAARLAARAAACRARRARQKGPAGPDEPACAVLVDKSGSRTRGVAPRPAPRQGRGVKGAAARGLRLGALRRRRVAARRRVGRRRVRRVVPPQRATAASPLSLPRVFLRL